MKILENIKKFFENKTKKVKALPEANVDNKQSENWRKTQRVEQSNLLKEPKVKSLSKIDESILQYTEEYYESWLRGEENYRSYNVLVGLNTEKEPQGNNKEKQEKLLKLLYSDKKYYLQTQANAKTGESSFFHILHGNYEEDENKIIRLYVNAKRENVAELSYAVLQQMGEQPFYFKMMSDELMERKNRSDKLVFYTNEEQLTSVISALIQIKKEQPKLLQGAENDNPFMKKVEGFIGYAPNPRKDFYINKEGKSIMVEKTYNIFLSKALEESFTLAMQDIVAKDEMLTKRTNAEIGDINCYMRAYPIIRQKYEDIFIKKIKENLQVLKNKNPDIEIAGLGEIENVR